MIPNFIEILKEFTSATIPLASQPVLDSTDGPRKKKSKAEAIYVKHPVNDDECSFCTMFRAPGSCTLVEGVISPNGHCKYFEYGKSAALDLIVERVQCLKIK